MVNPRRRRPRGDCGGFEGGLKSHGSVKRFIGTVSDVDRSLPRKHVTVGSERPETECAPTASVGLDIAVGRQHAENHSLAQRQLSRGHSKHPSKGARQMRRIRETGTVGGLSRRHAVDQVARCTLEAKPQDVRS